MSLQKTVDFGTEQFLEILTSFTVDQRHEITEDFPNKSVFPLWPEAVAYQIQEFLLTGYSLAAAEEE